MRLKWIAKLLSRVLPPRRPPDKLIYGASATDPYLSRWNLIFPQNKWLNIMVHEYHRSDDDRANHDHPWWNVSFVLRGALMEWRGKHSEGGVHLLVQGDVVRRAPETAHRIELLPPPRPTSPVTLFVTGRKVREWGFWCPKGWRHNKEFVSPKDDGFIGRGCD